MLELSLKPREERRLRAGHLWVYSNELQTPPGFAQIAPGTLCRVQDHGGRPLGVGTVNPHSLLAVRLLSGDGAAVIDEAWFLRRLQAGLSLRERLYDAPYYRLVYGEGDGLPGLVIDRYDAVLVVQISTAGMEGLKPLLIPALQSLLQPRGLLFVNDLPMRATEGLPQQDEVIGEVPEYSEVLESGVRFRVPLAGGQKTGWFYDQRHNRDRLAPYARDARVLDVFSYAGGWALRALAAGARQALCLDRSEAALTAARESAELNGQSLETLQGEALDGLRALRAEARQFDLVIVDPPALIKRRKDHAKGLEHYAALNRAALHLLAPGGFLIACSCSHHLEEAELQRLLLREARGLGRRLQILDRGGQGPDHPVHPAIPETRYLKALYTRVN